MNAMNGNLKDIYIWWSHMNAYKKGVLGEICPNAGEGYFG
jgi:hypothetical protein